ncbi:hypothetical protein M3Y97_00537200 [Aphelenchoides bicaudatus]|nr:hypothetical protein M3Y97_00537200 [Aphelenchoides bicaudatus]
MIWLSVLLFTFIPAILIVQCEPKKSKEAKTPSAHLKVNPAKPNLSKETKLEHTTRLSFKDEDDVFEFRFDEDVSTPGSKHRKESAVPKLSERTCKSDFDQGKSAKVEPTQGTESYAPSEGKADGLRKNKDLGKVVDTTQRSTAQSLAKSPGTPQSTGKSPGTPGNK